MKTSLYFFVALIGTSQPVFASGGLADRVNSIGKKYCEKAGTYLSEDYMAQQNFSDVTRKYLRAEHLVLNNLCDSHGVFGGRASYSLPESIAVNTGSLCDSWQQIAQIFHAASSPYSMVVVSYAQECTQSLKDNLMGQAITSTGEFFVEMRKKGLSDDEIKKRLFELLAQGHTLNVEDRRQ